MNTWAGKLLGGLALTVVLSFNALATTFYVNVSNTVPVSPFNSWATAANNIQDAIDAAVAGDQVLVTNGIYKTGGRTVTGSTNNIIFYVSYKSSSTTVTNRVVVDKAVTVSSANGPSSTIIQGGGPTGSKAIRCVFLGDGAVLNGFTLTNGATDFGSDGVPAAQDSGGGIICEASTSVVTNCVIIGNSGGQGGGVFGGTLNNCQIAYNTSTVGGGVLYATADRCVIKNNEVTTYDGGGAYNCSLNDCLVLSNSAHGYGGGAAFSKLSSCTIVSNSATASGGVERCKVTNCIVYFNSGSGPTPNFGENSVSGGTDTLRMKNCCTTPLPSDYGFSSGGNISNSPAFVNFSAGNFHLQTNSPCINTGNNAFVTDSTDLDGNPRIVGLAVDIGAYEKSPASILPTFWLLPYNLPNDGSADYLDSDGDGLNNWQEWKAGTVPTNATSVLKLSSPSNSLSGMKVTWQSVSGVTYYLQRGTNLAVQPVFSSIKSNLVGQVGSTSYTDSTATNDGPYYYRLGVQ